MQPPSVMEPSSAVLHHAGSNEASDGVSQLSCLFGDNESHVDTVRAAMSYRVCVAVAIRERNARPHVR